MITNAVRWVLTAALLLIVWCHAHWSVASALTFLTLTAEVNSHLWRAVADKAGLELNVRRDDENHT